MRLERIENSHRVGKAEPPRAGGLGCFDNPKQEVDVRPGRVFTADANLHPRLERAGNHVANRPEHCRTVAIQLVADLQIGDRDGQIDQPRAQPRAGVQIIRPHPAPDHQRRLQSASGHGSNAGALFGAHAGDPDLQFGHTRPVEVVGDRDLLFDRERHSSRLFAVAERRVIQ